jgi:rSAM/selenodomain-associated transferase 2
MNQWVDRSHLSDEGRKLTKANPNHVSAEKLMPVTHHMTNHLSVIVPVLNEADEILDLIESVRGASVELIIVDGGSSDATAAIARRTGTRVIDSGMGRARQMNAGAKVATGDSLLFLHADTRLPEGFEAEVCRALVSSRHDWGRFDVRLSGQAYGLRLVEFMMNLRSRLTGICTGDQAMYVRREAFESIGGFPEISLMEDIAVSKKLRGVSRPHCSALRVTTSSRRWETRGIVKTVLLMWRLRSAYFFGASPDQLARRYSR